MTTAPASADSPTQSIRTALRRTRIRDQRRIGLRRALEADHDRQKDGEQSQIDIPDFYFMDGEKDLSLDDQKEARNAMIRVDGFPIELESNDMKDFLPGVNMHLKQAAPDKPFTMTITEDTQKMSGKVKDMIDQVNGILGFIKQQNTVDENPIRARLSPATRA